MNIKPIFVFNHFCEYHEGMDEYCVYEKSKTLPSDVILRGTPLAHGRTIIEAVNNAESMGIKHYDIEIIGEVDV